MYYIQEWVRINATFGLTRKFGKYGSYIPYDMVINYGTGSRKIKKKNWLIVQNLYNEIWMLQVLDS